MPPTPNVVQARDIETRQTSVATPSLGERPPANWWIAQALTLPARRRTGWIVAQALEEFKHEAKYAQACNKYMFNERMRTAGLTDLLEPTPPRKRCKAIAALASESLSLLDERAQRLMIESIGGSLDTYMLGN